MTATAGTFVWYELLTPDTAAAQAFYRAVLGWDYKASEMTTLSYTIISKGPAMVGGMLPISAEMAAQGMRPLWMGYIAVDEVDAMAKRMVAKGGTLHKAGTDIPGVGRFAVVADPQGAPFVLFKGVPPPQPPPVVVPGTPGHVAWHEYISGAPGTFPLYSELFGWTKGETMTMGPDFTYQIFNINGVMAGGIASTEPTSPPPHWRFYVAVEHIDRARERVIQAKGIITMEPQAVPGGGWIVHGVDPQGAHFALVGPRA